MRCYYTCARRNFCLAYLWPGRRSGHILTPQMRARLLLVPGPGCTPRTRNMWSDDEWTMSQTQQQPDESSQDELRSINGSQIRHGPHRLALVETMNQLDQMKPGEKSAKRFRRRVDLKCRKGVPMSAGGSGYGEPVTGTGSLDSGQKRSNKRSKLTKPAFDFDALSDDDQDDFQKPGQVQPKVPKASVAHRQNKGKLLWRDQAHQLLEKKLQVRHAHNKLSARIRQDLQAQAPEQFATASEYPCGGNQSLANPPFSTRFDADEFFQLGSQFE